MHIRTRPSTKITLLCLQLLCGESAFPCRQLLTMVKGVERIKEGDWGGKGHFSVRPQVLITDSLVLFSTCCFPIHLLHSWRLPVQMELQDILFWLQDPQKLNFDICFVDLVITFSILLKYFKLCVCCLRSLVLWPGVLPEDHALF